MAWLPMAIGGLGSIISLTKKGKGKKQEYAPQAPEYQQQFGKEFFEMLQQLGGQAGTPYPGQVSAPWQNPFTSSAMNLWNMSPYGQMGGMGQPGMGMGMGGGQQMPQMPMPQPPQLPQAASMGGGMGGAPKGPVRRKSKPLER